MTDFSNTSITAKQVGSMVELEFILTQLLLESL
jgi:hypothetical protein